MDYAREGGYFYPKESGMDKDEEEEIREVVVHEKGRSTVGVFFFEVSLVSRCISPTPSVIWQISTRPLSPTKPPKGKTSSLLNGLITNTTGRELHITGHRSRLSREEMNDLERGNSPVGSTHSALLDHVEEARNGYAAAAAAAEAAGESHRKRSRSWSRTWTGRTRVEGHGGKKTSKEKNEVAPTPPPPTMSHTKSSSSIGSRPVTPNKITSRKKFSISGGLSGTHAGLAAIAAPKRPEEEVERPPRTPTKPAPTAAVGSDPKHGRSSTSSKSVTASPAPATSSAISSSTHSLTPPSVPKKSIHPPPCPATKTGASTKGASQRSRPPSRPLPPPPPPLEDENITAAGHAGGEVAMTNTFNSTRPMTSVHDHRLSASTNIDTNSSTTTNTTEQQGPKPTLPSGVSGMATTVTTRGQRSNLLDTPPPLPPKLAVSTSEGSATKPRVLPPPNHRFSLTLYGPSTGYNPGSSCFLGSPTSSL